MKTTAPARLRAARRLQSTATWGAALARHLALGAALALASTGWAQPGGEAPVEGALPEPVPTLPAESATPCESTDPTTAEVNGREGVRLAKAGKYGEAVPLFRMAVKLDGCAPDHLLLLARALARSGERGEARTHYEAVVARFAGSLAARRAEAELATLDTPGAGEGVAEGEAPPASRWPIIGGMTAAAGAMVAVGGVFFALDAQGADEDLQRAAREPDRGAYDELVDRRSRSSTLAYVFYGVGAATAVAGGVLFFAGDRIFGATAPAAMVTPTPGGGVINLGGRF